MTPVYEAANSTDAYLVKNLLEQAGVPSYIRGEYLQGGLGDLPAGGLIHVCVADSQAEHAREIVLDWEQSSSRDGDDFANEASETPVAPPASPSRRSAIVALLIGAVAGAFLTWATLRGPPTENGVDYNGDGIVDERAIFSGDVLKRVEFDRNRDGKADAVSHFDRNGAVSQGQNDDDFDGRMESAFEYLHGQWLTQTSDIDGDGSPDYQSEAISGVIYSEEWLDPAGHVLKRARYDDGRIVTSDLDSNRDGRLDTRRFHDSIGEIEKTEPLKLAK
ncbi:DUF2007 domain-containing protein [Lysobacter koreensis]|uniref:DUF2007 domain-containing protein n=1 Tax=Lysobacter koreensis TaxID=266122 RepID=A0ABW2YPD2_9GAMM